MRGHSAIFLYYWFIFQSYYVILNYFYPIV